MSNMDPTTFIDPQLTLPDHLVIDNILEDANLQGMHVPLLKFLVQ